MESERLYSQMCKFLCRSFVHLHRARNAGRLATEIDQVGFQMSKAEERRQIVGFKDVLGMPIQLPRTLGAGGTTSVMYAADRVLAMLHSERLTGKDART